VTDLSLLQLGSLELPNRFVMAPLTRNRAGVVKPPASLLPSIRQRAGAGLIISEGTQPCAVGQGYPIPGLHSDEQVAGWTLVANAVHARGGRIFAQLMHAGRISHEGSRLQPVAPSVVTPARGLHRGGMRVFRLPAH